MNDVMTRLAATLVDRYTIERELGQGGMATVYLALDLKHDRKVAIKVLKPELAAVLGAERFVQEIKTTAALSHPHILPLFDSGEAGGFLYYVMPYIQGETIREKLNRETQLGIADAVKITTEVADALDYAHRHGVIHRDIKPENILLHDGRPMVMDFGIALAVSAAAGGRMTETGLSLGTPHYMSPEQATADKEITGRSDIYSLASVLYEMLAGNPPHTGSSAQQIIMKIIVEPVASVTKQRKSVPANVAEALDIALEKLPADRFASAHEFSEALQGRAAPLTTARHAARTPTTIRTLVRHPAVAVLTLALVAATTMAVIGWRGSHQVTTDRVVRFHLDLPSSILFTNAVTSSNVAVSPDGSTLAYTMPTDNGSSRLFVRRLDEAEARGFAGTEGAQQPCFSPDGKWIAYLLGLNVWKVDANGGTPVLVGASKAAAVGLTWSATHGIVLGTSLGLVAIPAAGGEARVIVASDSTAGDLYFNDPHVLADGTHVLFTIQTQGGLAAEHLGIGSLDDGKLMRTTYVLFDPLGVVDGALVYVTATGAMMAVPIDVARGRVTGTPVTLALSVATTTSGASQAALSAGGTLIYQSVNANSTLGWVDSHGAFQSLLGAPQPYAFPRLSPNGHSIAMTVGSGSSSDIWLYDMASSTPVRLTNTGTGNERPEWTPDGRSVLFRSNDGARSAMWSVPVDRSTAPKAYLASDHHTYYEGVVSPDGRYVAYQVDDAGRTQADVEYRGLEGDTAVHPIAASNSIEAQPRFSPDGKWLAYVTDESGASQVVVRPFPGPGGQVQVSVTGGVEPVWSRDGKHLFYRDGRHLVDVSVATAPQFTVTSRTNLFTDVYLFALAPHANYDVSLDGTHFLMMKSAMEPKLVVVYNWMSELRRQLPRGP